MLLLPWTKMDKAHGQTLSDFAWKSRHHVFQCLHKNGEKSRAEETESCHKYPVFHLSLAIEHPMLIWMSIFVAF